MLVMIFAVCRSLQFLSLVLLPLLTTRSAAALGSPTTLRIDELVRRWAPLVWLNPAEQFMPLGVTEFLQHALVADKNGVPNSLMPASLALPTGLGSEQFYLITNNSIENLLQDGTSFLYGKNPENNKVPVYAIVTHCTPYKSFHNSEYNNVVNDIATIFEAKAGQNLYFHVTYWFFYPYNQGKEVCVLARVPTPLLFNTCLGKRTRIGNHLGDWEHMSLSFAGHDHPDNMYVSVHDAGVYYKYDLRSQRFKYEKQVIRKGVIQRPKFPPWVRTSRGHPVLFSALGSHGLWSAPGQHFYVRVPRLVDDNGYGSPWLTWNMLHIIHATHGQLPYWMQYLGKWGNPKSDCYPSKKIGVCTFSDGPSGVLRRVNNFVCPKIIAY